MRSACRLLAILVLLTAGCLAQPALAQRKITPVNNKSTATQPVNELEGDTARINARMRASMKHYHDENGYVVYVDTVTGKEWRDSSSMQTKKRMLYPLLQSVSVGVDLWNPVMRVFGQHYGVIGFAGHVNMHNRYFPTLELGLGQARNTPPDLNYTYSSPLGMYCRIGADYNVLYNSTTDYQFFVGLRYGFSPFSYNVTGITINDSYWGEKNSPTIPSQRCTAGWMEITIGLKVNLWGPIYAGWAFRYHSILHESRNKYGDPWYIPGYGARGASIGGSLNIWYTLDINKRPVPTGLDMPGAEPETDTLYMPQPKTDDPYRPGVTDSSSMQRQDEPETGEE